MKIVANVCLSIALVGASMSASAKEPVRINATSVESFDKSFTKLVRSLKSTERRSLALGLFGALLAHQCLAPDAVIHLTFYPVEPKDVSAIRPCREHLDGMSYKEILKAGEPRKGQPSATRPNNSFVPTHVSYAAFHQRSARAAQFNR